MERCILQYTVDGTHTYRLIGKSVDSLYKRVKAALRGSHGKRAIVETYAWQGEFYKRIAKRKFNIETLQFMA